MKKSKIKEIKHKMRNRKLQVSSVAVDPGSFTQVKELALISAVANYLETHGIEQDVISFMDEAIEGNNWKTKIAADIAYQIEQGFKDSNITADDVKTVKLINTEAL